MPWVVGIDEAGYGPNLGPLVQAAVALRLPADDLAGWATLSPWVRRAHERDDGRLLIDDSKKVYAGPHGFARLERGVRGGFGLAELTSEAEWESWLAAASPSTLEAYRPAARARLVPPQQFNAILREADSKAVVLSRGLIELLRAKVAAVPDEPVLVVCDKQGGRNFYGPFLQDAFPDGWVVAERESAAESRYRVAGLGREVTVVFRPKADGDSVCVALASMVCKYLREVCMAQFNAFWQTHVPGLRPTAGYPVDAKRFYAEIQPAMERLGIHPDAVWRKK
jgi:hypothetical protein